MLGFAIVDEVTWEPKNDPAYVEWTAYFKNFTNDEESEKIMIDVLPCTEQDYSKFYPTLESNKEEVEKLKEKKALYCLQDL